MESSTFFCEVLRSLQVCAGSYSCKQAQWSESAPPPPPTVTLDRGLSSPPSPGPAALPALPPRRLTGGANVAESSYTLANHSGYREQQARRKAQRYTAHLTTGQGRSTAAERIVAALS